jgi:DNA-binding NtrC family response regulator
MPARIVIVHDKRGFAASLTVALRSAGHDVTAFTDTLAAWDALDEARRVEVLVTRVNFRPGKPSGISLARMARYKRPSIQAIFLGLPEFAEHTAELGEFIPMPASVSDVVHVVTRLLESGAEVADPSTRAVFNDPKA